ncbi:hypothetical protein Sjap_013212 [Stephania japonica]|uniref:Uncharacterized protein n=1 Tax=Stephania japonica TaxID=461633 RepID=A0AAP0NZN3_9MAGN
MDQTCKRKHCFSRNCEEIKERSEVGEDDLRLGGDDSRASNTQAKGVANYMRCI